MQRLSRRGAFATLSAAAGGLALRNAGATPPQEANPPGRPADHPSIRDFGGVGDGRDSDADALQRAYDAISREGGGTLFLPQGRYRANLVMRARNVRIIGAGNGATFVSPLEPDGTALTALYRNGDPTPVGISDLCLVGREKNRGTLFAAGGATGEYTPGAEYSGSTTFDRCDFRDAERAIVRRFGTIGLWVDHCRFAGLDYAFHVTTDAAHGDTMHGGCMAVTRSWFSDFRRAMLYLSSPVDGTGQISFDQNIAERADGWVFYIDRCGGGRTPAIHIRDHWNEQTGSGAHVAIGAAAGPAGYLFARDVRAPILLENSPPGRTVLRTANLLTDRCDLSDFDADVDTASSIVHEQASALEGTPDGLARSLAAPPAKDPLRSPWFHMPLPRGTSTAWHDRVIFTLSDASLLLDRRDGTAPARRAAASIIPGLSAAQAIDVAPSSGVLLRPRFTAPADSWLVAIYVYRLTGGGNATIRIDGAAGRTGPGRLRAGGWRCLVGIALPASPLMTGETVIHRATAAGTVEVAACSVVSCRSVAEALEVANGGLVPV